MTVGSAAAFVALAMAAATLGCAKSVAELSPLLGGDSGPPPDADAGATCIIAGQTYGARANNPADLTLCCNPRANLTGWSSRLTAGPSYQITTQYSMSAADFNGDGLPDLALCVPGAIEVLLGVAGEGLGPPMSSPANLTGCAMVAADINHDGLADVIFANGDRVGVLLGAGGGKLAGEVDYLAGEHISEAVVDDFNGDGWPDVAAADCSGNVTILFNLATGDGSLGNARTYGPGYGTSGTCQLRAGDFDGDGRLDFATTSCDSTNTVAIALNQGGDAFAAPLSNTQVSSPWALWTGKLGSGRVDDLVVGTNSVLNTYVVGQDLGGLTSASAYQSGAYQGALAVADFDGDGHPDILAGGQYALNLLYNHGDGTFSSPASISLPHYIQWITVADFNGDGAPDVAVIYQWNELALWYNGCP